jgi:hypothetical protein
MDESELSIKLMEHFFSNKHNERKEERIETNDSPKPTPSKRVLLMKSSKALQSNDSEQYLLPLNTSHLLDESCLDLEQVDEQLAQRQNQTNEDVFFHLNNTISNVDEVNDVDLGFGRKRMAYSSSTMPTPRKPRKKYASNVKDANNQTHQVKSMNETDPKPVENANVTKFVNSLFFADSNITFNSIESKFLIDDEQSQVQQANQTAPCNNSSLLLFSSSSSSCSSPSSRYMKLKRPSAPPPPLPKPAILPQPSPQSKATTITSLSENKSTIELSCDPASNSDSSLINTTNELLIQKSPQMSSTPHLVNKSHKLNNYLESRFMISTLNNKTNQPFKVISSVWPSPQLDGAKIGFEKFDLIKSKKNELLSKSPSSAWKRKLATVFTEFKRYSHHLTFDSIVFALAILTFLLAMSFITVFQTKAHFFYQKFVDSTNNNSHLGIKDEKYHAAGSHLVKQTILLCNGPYFSYQTSNLVVLPFSFFLIVVFSCFSKRETCFVSRRLPRRPGLPSSLNPFQRRNRFLVAALYCILANEIFKMIESSLFSTSTESNFNTTSEFLRSIFEFNSNITNKSFASSFSSFAVQQRLDLIRNTEFLQIGLGLEPDSMSSTTKSSSTTFGSSGTLSNFIMAPSILRYSKPKLPPRLRFSDLQPATTTQSTTTAKSNIHFNRILNEPGVVSSLLDENSTLQWANRAKNLQNKTRGFIESLNTTLENSSSQTLFEISWNLVQNEYVQAALNRLFSLNQSLKWSLIMDKLKTLAFMTLEVFIIGMRYYPLLGVLDKNSLVCLCLASIYMWADMLYNLTITGICEGLKLNLSFDLLRDIRKVFGVGFVNDAKTYLKIDKNSPSHQEESWLKNELPIDANLLFSTNRIIYTIVKCLPHFFCLSYVTIRLSSFLILRIYKKLSKKLNQINSSTCGFNSNSHSSVIQTYNKNYEYLERDYIVNSNLSSTMKRKYNLIYAKKFVSSSASGSNSASSIKGKLTNLYSKMVIQKQQMLYESPTTTYIAKYTLSFEDRYVRNLLNKSKTSEELDEKREAKSKLMRFLSKFTWFNWVSDENFRFSTRIVCTYTVCFTVLYYLTCFLVFYGSIFIDLIYLPNFYKHTLALSTCLTSLVCFVQLVLGMRQFKTHLQSLYKGQSEKYITSKSIFSNRKIAVNSFNYAGNAVTYTCWGYVFLFVLFTFILFQIASSIYFGNTTNNLVLIVLVVSCPILVSFLLIKLLNKLVCSLAAKYCFLQRNAKVLALKNLKMYSLFLYFKFFYDCFTGIAFCFVRMLTSIIMSVVFMPRLDYSFMGRTMEKMDSGFMSYVGYLHWESHHTNPILISFCEHLRRTLKLKRKFKLDDKMETKRNRLRNKWFMCYLLIKNPSLAKFRRNASNERL